MAKKTQLVAEKMFAGELGKLLTTAELTLKAGDRIIATTRRKVRGGGELVKVYHIPLSFTDVFQEVEDEPVPDTAVAVPEKKARKKPGPKPKKKAEAAEPEAAEPEAAEPEKKARKKPGPKPKKKAEAVEPEAVEPEKKARKKPGPKPKKKAEAVEPEAVEPEVAEPEVAEPEVAEPEAVEPEAAPAAPETEPDQKRPVAPSRPVVREDKRKTRKKPGPKPKKTVENKKTEDAVPAEKTSAAEGSEPVQPWLSEDFDDDDFEV